MRYTIMRYNNNNAYGNAYQGRRLQRAARPRSSQIIADKSARQEFPAERARARVLNIWRRSNCVKEAPASSRLAEIGACNESRITIECP